MTAAVDSLRDHAARLGREVHDAGDLGLGVEFADGNDAFWLLTDPVVTTMPTDADPAAVVAEYDRLDRLRDGAVRIIRHHLAFEKARVERPRDGQWGYDTGRVSGGLDVGPRLTRICRGAGDVHAATKRERGIA